MSHDLHVAAQNKPLTEMFDPLFPVPGRNIYDDDG